MRGGAQLSVTEMRQASRHSVHLPTLAEHRQLGDIRLLVVNVSSTGFMVRGAFPLGRGERVTVRLPQIGRIEAFVVWADAERAGFQFERVIRPEEFHAMLKLLEGDNRLRLHR